MRRVALIAVALFWPSLACAQDYGLSGPAQIETETLGAAQDFDAGVLTDGALDSQLWQGTSAARATQLLSNAPLQSKDPIIRDMVRTVILSGGVPPRATNASEDAAYGAARLQAVMGVGEGEVLDGFLARNPDLAQSPLAQVDLVLAKGDHERACEISDAITTGRGEPQWVRLRAACHALRGEMPAAELTRDLLRSSGYDNPDFYAQLGALIADRPVTDAAVTTDALTNYLANYLARQGQSDLSSDSETGNPEAGREADLAALFEVFYETDLATLENALGNISFDVAAPDLDLETALSDSSARATARLFILGRAGDVKAFEGFMSRALRAGVHEDDLLLKLTPLIQTLPAQARVEANLRRYARAALLSRDLGSLQSLYSALPDGPAQARIALAADAIGGGFNGQGLGRDIETRLADPATQAQALKDVQMALALGARLSDPVADILSESRFSSLTLPASQIALLDAAVDANSRAETTLRAATLLSRDNLNLTDRAEIVTALRRAGLPRFAGQIAAETFLDAL